MSEHSIQPIAELRKQHARVMSALEKECPNLVKQLRNLEMLIRASENGPKLTYGRFHVIDAIELCLQLHKAWMTKAQITDALIEGGFPQPAETVRLVVGDAVKYHGKPGGRLIRDGEKGEWTGLPEWADKKSIKRLK